MKSVESARKAAIEAARRIADRRNVSVADVLKSYRSVAHGKPANLKSIFMS